MKDIFRIFQVKGEPVVDCVEYQSAAEVVIETLETMSKISAKLVENAQKELNQAQMTNEPLQAISEMLNNPDIYGEVRLNSEHGEGFFIRLTMDSMDAGLGACNTYDIGQNLTIQRRVDLSNREQPISYWVVREKRN